MKVSLIQMNSAGDKSENLKTAAALIDKAVADEQPDLIVLPEYYAFLGEGREDMHDSAETFPRWRVLPADVRSCRKAQGDHPRRQCRRA